MHLKIIILFILALNKCFVKSDNSKVQDLQCADIYIDLPNGRLRGRDNGFYYSYESIPYAEPPLGDLRFEPPKAYSRQWKGVFDATKKAPTCLQWDQFKEGADKLTGKENCLTVSIYKPKTYLNLERLPVFVLLHGGCFMFGSVNAMRHDQVMRNGRALVVKISYRVGPLGFLSTEDDILPGNYGIKDQRLAMQWIKQNIAYFGGDPEAVVIMGFSAGAASIHLLMLERSFSQYAKAAVSFSGTALNPWVIMHNARARAYALAKLLKCAHVHSSESIKKCLKRKPASAIVQAVRHFLVFGYTPFTTFGPVIEPVGIGGAILTRSPEEIMRSGAIAQIPWLVSYTAQDGGYNAAELLQKIPPNGVELIEQLNERWHDLAPYALFYKNTMDSIDEMDNHSMWLLQHYMKNETFSVHSYLNLQRMYTDVLFKNGIEQTVRLARMHGGQPIYSYVYDNPADRGVATYLANRTDISFGTVHGDDFFLIFNVSARNKQLRPDEAIISRNFIKMLEDFAYNSNELVFGACKFVDNARSSENLQLMFIRRNGCGNHIVKQFP